MPRYKRGNAILLVLSLALSLVLAEIVCWLVLPQHIVNRQTNVITADPLLCATTQNNLIHKKDGQRS